MRHKQKLIFKGLLIFNVIIVVLFQFKATPQAASMATQAKNSYYRLLTQKYISWTRPGDKNNMQPTAQMQFALLDLDNDKVPELYIYHKKAYGYQSHYRLFKYKNGKAEMVPNMADKITKIYPGKKIFTTYTSKMGTTIISHNSYSNGKIKTIAQSYKYSIYKNQKVVSTKTTYYVKGKTVSKKVYNTYIRKLTNNAKNKSFKLLSNTIANRKKYLSTV